MLLKSMSALLFNAACQAEPTKLYEFEQEVENSDGDLIKILFILESEFYYDESVGDIQQLITSVHVDHPDPFGAEIIESLQHRSFL